MMSNHYSLLVKLWSILRFILYSDCFEVINDEIDENFAPKMEHVFCYPCYSSPMFAYLV